MPRPKTKKDLIEQSDASFRKLTTLVDSIPNTQKTAEFPEGTMNRNVRDVLAHLHHWHKMMLSWYNVGMSGEKPAMPAEGYTWKTIPDLNREINKLYSKVALPEIESLLKISHANVHALIAKHSDAELFTKMMYSWTGSTSLGAYLISSTSSHYDWAMRLIKRSLASG